MEPTIGTITGIMKPGVDLVIAFPEAEYIVEFVSAPDPGSNMLLTRLKCSVSPVFERPPMRSHIYWGNLAAKASRSRTNLTTDE